MFCRPLTALQRPLSCAQLSADVFWSLPLTGHREGSEVLSTTEVPATFHILPVLPREQCTHGALRPGVLGQLH